MFNQIKYAFLDIKTSKRISLIFFLQMIVVFLLVNSSIVSFIRVNDGLQRLEKLKNNKAYINRDATSDAKVDALIADKKNSIPKLKELYKYIANNDRIGKYSRWDFATNENIEGHRILQSTANKLFFDMYDIKVINGHMFDKSDFTKTSEIIPIIIGYSLKDRYKLGNTYEENDSVINKKVIYKVIGILEPNSSYPSLVDIGSEYNLNYTYFKPLNIDLLNDFGSLDMAISSTVVFSSNENEVRLIEEKSNELGLFSMQYRVLQERINEFLGYFEKKLIYQVFLAFIMLLFAIISMALNFMTIISKKTKEFSIHIICGGGIRSIIQRLLWQLLLILTVALVPTIIIYGLNISLIYTILLACFIILLVMIMPYIKIRTITVAQLIRRSE